MTISYIAPFERAWARTRRILFGRFSPELWIVVGFSSFLAGLVGGWAGLGFSPGRGIHLSTSLDDLVLTPQDLMLHSNFTRIWLLGFPLLVLAALITLALLWVSSRGKFIFLENLVHERGAIVQPWHRFRDVGNSLFLWRLGFALVLTLVFGIVLSPLVLFGEAARHWGGLGLLGALAGMTAAFAGIVVAIVAAYVALLLEGFVIPLMYRRDITASAAWRALWPLVRRQPAEFVVFGILVAAAWLLVAACLFVVGVSTCCLLFFLLSVPYLNAVVLLPLSTVFRLYTVEFLEQFGDDYRILPIPPSTPPMAGAPAPPPPAPDSTPDENTASS